MLLPVFLPNRSGAVAFSHINHLFIEMLLRFGLALWRDLTDVGVVDTAGAVEHHERAGHAFQIPRSQLDFINILDEETFDHGDSLSCLPFPVRVDSFGLEVCGLLSSFRHWCALPKESILNS